METRFTADKLEASQGVFLLVILGSWETRDITRI